MDPIHNIYEYVIYMYIIYKWQLVHLFVVRRSSHGDFLVFSFNFILFGKNLHMLCCANLINCSLSNCYLRTVYQALIKSYTQKSWLFPRYKNQKRIEQHNFKNIIPEALYTQKSCAFEGRFFDVAFSSTVCVCDSCGK